MKSFVTHLRLPYLLFLLPGPYLIGGALSPRTAGAAFILQYLVLHVLLFGGSTVYNSYWDKDEGPIGFLKHPPTMKPWMLSMSWSFQILGILASALISVRLLPWCLFGVLASWVYSSPHIRWKGRPWLSLLAVGAGSVFASVMIGYVAYGGMGISSQVIQVGLASTCFVLSFYPISQTFQIDEDRRRGDETFAVHYGMTGVKSAFIALYGCGVALGIPALPISLALRFVTLGVTSAVGFFVWQKLLGLRGEPQSYGKIMSLKLVGGLTFSLVALLLAVRP
jgi:4-hydroxybenzoate polyprenyltransferase